MASHSTRLDDFEAKYVRPAPGLAYVIGSKIYREKPDRRKLFEKALGIDMLPGDGVDFVLDLEEPLPGWIDHAHADHIECMSTLEHSRRPWLMAANLERILKPGGTIFVSVPFVWRIHAYPSDYWRMTPEGLRSIFPNIEWSALMLASDRLSEKPGLEAVKVEGHPYMARAETCGFGRRK